MSESFISIVPDAIDKTQAKELANKVVSRLVQQGIIKKELTDCVLGKNGYAPGDNYKEVILGDDNGFKNLLTNGFEVRTTRQVFHNGNNGLDEIRCPNCNEDVIDANWQQALEEWINETDQDKIICQNCNIENSITKYIFCPTWGFGNLGFIFWNWPDLKSSFINDIEQVLGLPVKVIYGRF